jgi:hypothetical protein
MQKWKVEGSIFTGREPDQHRYNIEEPKFDSYSGRVNFDLNSNWNFQGSYGWLNDPEQINPVPHSQRIILSSTQHYLWGNWVLDNTEVWAKKINAVPGNTLDALLIESTAHILKKNIAYFRYQFADEDELLPLGTVDRVHEMTFGYTYDFLKKYHTRWGVGGLTSFDILPDSYKPFYGNFPVSFMFYVRMAID